MSHNDFIERLSKKSGMSAQKTEKLLKAYVNAVREEVEKGNSVNIRNFGIFELVEKAQRKIFNPSNKQYTVIPAKKTVKFKPSSVMKAAFK